MNVNIVAGGPLYVIEVESTGIPYLMKNEFFQLYTDEQAAIKAAEKISARYPAVKRKTGNNAVCATVVSDARALFEKISLRGIKKFILNGEGEIFDGKDFFENLPPTDETLKDIMFLGQLEMFGSNLLGGRDIRVHKTNVRRRLWNDSVFKPSGAETKPVIIKDAATGEEFKWLPVFTDKKAASKFGESGGPTVVRVGTTFEKNDSLFSTLNKKDKTERFMGVIINPGEDNLTLYYDDYLTYNAHMEKIDTKQRARERRWENEAAPLEGVTFRKGTPVYHAKLNVDSEDKGRSVRQMVAEAEKEKREQVFALNATNVKSYADETTQNPIKKRRPVFAAFMFLFAAFFLMFCLAGEKGAFFSGLILGCCFMIVGIYARVRYFRHAWLVALAMFWLAIGVIVLPDPEYISGGLGCIILFAFLMGMCVFLNSRNNKPDA